MKLGKEGIKLVILFQEKLGISLSEAVIILMKNKTSLSLLKEELALGITGINKNLGALMSVTMLRDFNDFEAIRENEIELIKKYYDIEIGKDNFLTTSRIIRLVQCNDCTSQEELICLYVDKFMRREKILNLLNKDSEMHGNVPKMGFLRAANSSSIKAVTKKENSCNKEYTSDK